MVIKVLQLLTVVLLGALLQLKLAAATFKKPRGKSWVKAEVQNREGHFNSDQSVPNGEFKIS